MENSDSGKLTPVRRTQNTFARGVLNLSICLAVALSCMSSHLFAEEVYNNLDAPTIGFWWGAGPQSDPHRMAGPDRTSQQFDLRGNHTITNVDLQLVRGGNPTGSVTFEIWEDDGFGFPGRPVGTLGSIEDISTFEPAFESFDEVVALGSEPTVSFDTVVSGLNPALPHHVVIDYTEATGIDTDGFRWLVTGGVDGEGPQTLVVGSDFPRLVAPLDEEGYGFGATPDLFSPSGDWILQSEIPAFDAFGDFRFANTTMSITAVPALTDGDANLDNEVNFADFLILSENFGQAGTWREGDFDGDGTIDFPDFLALSANFVGPANASAASVPEPTAQSIALFGLLGMIGFRKRR